MSQTIYGVPGSFCWAEVFTFDENKSKDFYQKLFSWTYSTSPTTGEGGTEGMHYTHAMIADGAVGGVMQINDEMKKQGCQPYWNSYIAVNDIDKTFASAVKLGAKVIMPPTDVPNAGRMAIMQDPTDAVISLWQSKAENKSAPRTAHGMVGWNELMTTDANKAKQFYTAVFGWGAVEEDMNGHTYVSFTLEGKYIGGMMEITKEMGLVPSHWGIYFTTSDIEASRRVAKDLGALELSPVISLPNIGNMVKIQDPSGAIFSLFQWAENKNM